MQNPESNPQLVEVETDDGQSLNIGEWINYGDGLWSLRINSLPTRGYGI